MINANADKIIAEQTPAASPYPCRNEVTERLRFGGGPALDWRLAD